MPNYLTTDTEGPHNANVHLASSMKQLIAMLITTMVLALAACGEGSISGGGEAPVLIYAPKTPMVKISLSATKVAVNVPLTISWVSTDATTCVGSDALSATQPVSGSVSVTHSKGGAYTYSITCAGVGTSATSKATVIVPMEVYATSYENKNLINFDQTQVPTVRALGIANVVSGEQDSIDRSIAFGDFFQEGKYSAFVMASVSDGAYGPNLPGNIPGVGYFLDQDNSGKWVDRSSELFKAISDRRGCISPSYTAVADFNIDSRPDIYIACTGVDFLIPGATVEQNQAAGRSFSVLYLSQSDGTYKSRRVEESNPMYGHKAAALDINGDRNIDIITTDIIDPSQPIGCGAPYVLLGRGDGTFTRDYRFIDQNILRNALSLCGMFNVDIIPIDGRYDIMVGGMVNTNTGSGLWNVFWAKGTRNGFDFSSGKILHMPVDTITSSDFQFPLDIIYDAKTAGFYMKTTGTNFSKGTNWAVLKFDLNGMFVNVVDTWFNATANFQPTSPQFKLSQSNPGYLLAYTGGCSADVSKGECGRQVTLR